MPEPREDFMLQKGGNSAGHSLRVTYETFPTSLFMNGKFGNLAKRSRTDRTKVVPLTNVDPGENDFDTVTRGRFGNAVAFTSF